jgi:hypothetical protein
MFGFDPISWFMGLWLVKVILASSAALIAIAVIAALWAGKPIIEGALVFLTPILRTLGKWGETVSDWLLDVYFNKEDGGIKDILDGWRTIVTVASLCFLCLVIGQAWQKEAPPPELQSYCKPVVDALRKDFKLVPRR